MKKCMVALMALMMTFSAYADSKKAIALAALPESAREIISTYFADQSVSYVTMEQDFLDVDFDVKMQNGAELEFDKKGLLKSIDMQNLSVPAQLLPELIKQYVEKNYPQAKIVKYAIDARDQEIKLDNGLELVFDNVGQFIGID